MIKLAAGAVATGSLLLSVGSLAAGVAATDLVSRGAYLANAGDCIACHTEPGGKPLAGGLMMNTPFGAISTPNISPDKASGIGAWTDAQFYRAMHDGIGHKGEYLYPVMPFPWYTSVTREDVTAIRAWLATQPAVNKPRKPNQLAFPFSVRESLLGWREAFFKPGEFKPDPNQSVEINRGAYLVNGLTHCGECHNARKVVGVSKWQGTLKGGVVDSWYAPNITSDVRAGIGSWSNEEIATYLKTGVSPSKGIALGPMAETIHSLSNLSDTDLLAIAAYLKTTPAAPDGDDQKHSLFVGRDARGAEAYLNFCASCHNANGKGLPGIIPALDGNGAVTAKGPENVVSVVLGGLPARDKYAPMPAIGALMSDQDIADVTNYVRQNWANAAPSTTAPDLVAKLRKSADTLMNVSPRQACPAIDASSIASAFAADRSGVRTQTSEVTEANMADRASLLVAKVRTVAPGTSQADLVNGLTSAYCSVVRADASLDWSQRSQRLGQFSQLIYMAASGHSPSGGSSIPAGTRRAAQK